MICIYNPAAIKRFQFIKSNPCRKISQALKSKPANKKAKGGRFYNSPPFAFAAEPLNKAETRARSPQSATLRTFRGCQCARRGQQCGLRGRECGRRASQCASRGQ
ncbi:MAG: hypothetical protein M3033_00420 [Acidobacteriota bacterium]|nr:hypothetical protein [Acidobacteriota bacterium]